MTSQPPGGEYLPPPDVSAGAPVGVLAAADANSYTAWITRVFAYVIDNLPVMLVTAIGFVWLFQSAWHTVETVCVTDDSEFNLGEFCATGRDGFNPTTSGWIVFVVCLFAAAAYVLWNNVVRQGRTGSSIGKQIMKFKVVDEESRQPIGAGKSFIRQLAHAIDGAICYIGFLFPLWDAKRQTIADKLMKTVCVPI